MRVFLCENYGEGKVEKYAKETGLKAKKREPKASKKKKRKLQSKFKANWGVICLYGSEYVRKKRLKGKACQN